MSTHTPLKARLAEGSGRLLTVWAMTAAFSTYFCMYAQEALAVGTFEGVALPARLARDGPQDPLHLGPGDGLRREQVLGIKVVSEMPSAKRAQAIGAFIGLAWLAPCSLPCCQPHGVRSRWC